MVGENSLKVLVNLLLKFFVKAKPFDARL